MQKLVRRAAACLGAFVFIIGAGLASAQAADPFAGTWKLNLGRTLTVTVKFADPKGNEFTNVSVYDRQ